MEGVFYLHEDDWGMVALIPAENMKGAEQTAREAEEFGQEHFDGAGWTEIYVIPEEEHPISERGIKLQELREWLDGRLPEAFRVASGYSTYREDVEKGFAFGGTGNSRAAFYRRSEGGVIMSLNVILPRSDDGASIDLFAEVLGQLGRKYRLILTDWWQHRIVGLEDKEALKAYLA